MIKQIAQVVVGLPVEGPFDYSIHPDFQEFIQVGMRVRILFNRRKMVGYVVGFKEESEFKNLNSIISLLDSHPALTQQHFQLIQEMSKYYGCSTGEAVESFLPACLRKDRFIKFQVKDITHHKNLSEKKVYVIHSVQNQWEILAQEVEKYLLKHQSVLILVPEQTLIPVVIKQMALKKEQVVNLHQKLPVSEDVERWIKVRTQRQLIVIGTRSAVFAPVLNFGLILMLEEDNDLYKEEQSPFYHARKIAQMRSCIEETSLVMTAPSLSLETGNAIKKKEFDEVMITAEEGPQVKVVDMTNYKLKKAQAISYPLREAIEKSLQNKERVILFLNRSGYQQNIQSTMKEFKEKVSSYFHYQEIDCIYKETAKLRSTSTIILASQAIFKFMYELKSGLTAVIDYDAELTKFNFRSSEKTVGFISRLKLMTKNMLIIQSCMTDDIGLKSLKKQDDKIFIKHELKVRRQLNMPPYKHLVAVAIRGKNEDENIQTGKLIYSRLQSFNHKNYDISEPYLDMTYGLKSREQTRYTIMCKGASVPSLLALIKTALKETRKKKGQIITVNVDP